MNIKNLTKQPLHLGRYTLRPGATTAIDNWDVLKGSVMAQSLLNAGAIAEEVVADAAPAKEKKAK